MLRLQGSRFIDEQGRERMLRGVNLGGSSKVPVRPDGATHLAEGFYDTEKVSFVGRPFPLAEAADHLARLRDWGLTLLRLLVPWEAIEHRGPGMYDHDYLDYIAEIVRLAGQYDMQVIIDPHQDVWSRWTGGDGAPAWTLESLGMDLRALHPAGAAYLQQEAGDAYGAMVWPVNNGRYAAATLWTLFFAGDLFAPNTTIDGAPAQYVLQGHFIDAMRQLAMRLQDMPQVLGFETLNEPAVGFIGCQSLDEYAAPLVRNGPSPTIWESMLLASGRPHKVRIIRQGMPNLPGRKTLLNPEGISIWKPGYGPLWQMNDVWSEDVGGNPQVLRDDHFGLTPKGQPVDFARDCFQPFVRRYATLIREVLPGMPVFVCPVPADRGAEHGIDLLPDDIDNLVYAPHWYDGITLGTGKYRPCLAVDMRGNRARLAIGRGKRLRTIRDNLLQLHQQAETRGVPALLGETGIPCNLDHGRAYQSGDFSDQVNAWNDVMQGVEAANLHVAFWNYTSDNSNTRGDQWNREDLSIYSPEQRTDPADIHSGGRALPGILRPYPVAVAGKLLSLQYEPDKQRLELVIERNPKVKGPTELYVPQVQYPEGWVATVTHGQVTRSKARPQHLIWHHDGEVGIQTLTLVPR